MRPSKTAGTSRGEEKEGAEKETCKNSAPILSGFPQLDAVLDSIRLGDNVVWQISELEEFRAFAEPFARQAVRQVYASTMDVSALEYRRMRGLDKKDEQMAILVQRVSGSYYGKYFMPP